MSVPATLCKRCGVLCKRCGVLCPTSDHDSHIGVAAAATALPIPWHGAYALVLTRLAPILVSEKHV